MKKYSYNVKLNKETKIKLNKENIIEDLRHLLTQVILKYNMMIEEWHYFLISYYNSNTKFYNDDILLKYVKKKD